MITYNAVECSNYLHKGSKAKPMTVIVGPVRLIGLPRKQNDAREFTDIIVGCNMFFSCCNMECTYSRASREARKLGNVPSETK